jgi:hypothetical protein
VITDGADGIVERQGYYFKMYLPDVTAGGVTPGIPEDPAGGTAAFPDSNNAEILWCCYAWPVDAEKTGNRTFFINQEGDLLQYDNRVQSYEALVGPAFDAAFDSGTGGGDMACDLGITAMGFTANDTFTWTVVGN